MTQVVDTRKPGTERGERAHDLRRIRVHAREPQGVKTGRVRETERRTEEVGTPGELMLESPLGRSLVRQGGAYWLPGLTPHDTRNEGTRPARLFEIFLKRCD